MLSQIRSDISQWFLNRLPQDGDRLILDRRRIYIIPTRQGLWYAVVLFLMLLGSINYGASLGYMLTFLLTGMGLLATLYTFRNLQNIEIRVATAEPVFAGETALLPTHLLSHSGRDYFDLDIGKRHDESLNVAADRTTIYDLPVATRRRGLQAVEPIRLSTEYPLGLFYAWSWFRPQTSILVYPRPLENSAPLPQPQGGDHPQQDGRLGQDDLTGIRPYREGDPIKRVTWKSLAKGLPLQTLEFQGDGDAELIFDWIDAPQGDIESKLSQLCRWILDAEALELQYGLRLPGCEIPMGRGPAHSANCLRHLALFQ